MTDLSPSRLIVRLDRKVSRAADVGKGLKISGDELELLIGMGIIEMLAESKARVLKEQSRCRQLRVVSTNGENSGLTSSGEPMGDLPAIDGISGGTTPLPDDSNAKARARRIFG